MKNLFSFIAIGVLGGGSMSFAQPASLNRIQGSDLSFYAEKLTETDFSRIPSPNTNLRASTSCYCQGGCFYASGDSYHFRKVVDVDCSLSLKAKKEKVVKELMGHYVEAHGVEAVPKILDNVAIKCFESSSN